MKRLFLVIAVLLFFPLSPVLAAHSCEVRPFSKSVQQGESVSYDIFLFSASATSSFSVRLGNLPTFVSGGFIATTSRQKATAVLSAQKDAQVGSFNIVVLYYEDTTGGVAEERVCQIGLRIQDDGKPDIVSAVGRTTVPVPSVGSNNGSVNISQSGGVKSPDALSVLPTSLSRDITVGEVTLASTSIAKILEEERLRKPQGQSLGGKGLTSPSFKKTLQRGMKHAEVTRLQDILKTLGFFPKSEESTGYFGPITKSGVRSLQVQNNIFPQYGIFGPKTRQWVNNLPAIE